MEEGGNPKKVVTATPVQEFRDKKTMANFNSFRFLLIFLDNKFQFPF